MNNQPQNPVYKYRKLIFIFLIVLLTVITGISNIDEISESLKIMFNTRLDSVIILIILLILYILIDAKLLQVSIDSNIKFVDSLLINLAGGFFSGITPLYIGSYPSRFYYLNQKSIPTDKILSGLTVKGLVYQIVISIFMILGLLIGGLKVVNSGGYQTLLILGIVYSVIITTFLIMISTFSSFNKLIIKLINKLSFKSKKINENKEIISNSVTNYYINSRRVYNDPLYSFKVYFYTFIKQIIFYSFPIVVFHGLGMDVNSYLFEIVAISTLMVIIVAVVPTPGGMGASEMAFIILFGVIYLDSTTLNAGLLIYRLFSYYLLIILGLIATLYLQAKKPIK